jgi:hypothetical protein
MFKTVQNLIAGLKQQRREFSRSTDPHAAQKEIERQATRLCRLDDAPPFSKIY